LEKAVYEEEIKREYPISNNELCRGILKYALTSKFGACLTADRFDIRQS
jgi:hypothetical protein